MPPKRRTRDDDAYGSEGNSDVSPAPAKRVRVSKKQLQFNNSIAASAPGLHTLESLLALSHDELAKHALDLQNQLSALQQGGSGSSGEVWSEEKIAERAKKTRDVCAAEIKKQMKWQPSCKGSTKWSYTGIVPHEDVFYKLFGFEKSKKPWKQKAIDTVDLEQYIGDISAPIRYNTLNLTGNSVKVHWDQDENTLKLTGTYGL
ncbi:unnamed protein product [Aureobasidium vineae]|uniref:Uncharacterized protein n=1 Tax=Aureobasidium vineae TaxID=2773715 RepID=A0A9N8PEL8_9PEZI|nr:unnamed protein product [Aureobasidium vineae]